MAARKPLNYSGIFFDSADLHHFKKWFDSRILGGATTNPLILQREGILNLPQHISKMIDISGPGFPIAIEIPDSDMPKEDMVNLAMKYHNKFPKNAVIKIPMDPREPEKAFEILYALGQKRVRVVATLGLSIGQLIGASEAIRHSKAQGDNFISLFWSRRNEARKQMVDILVKEKVNRKETVDMVPDAASTLATTVKYLENHSLNTKVIVGSIRSIDQIEKAFAIGADIVTIPPKLIEEWMYTKRGVETVDEFNAAYRSVKDKVTLI